MARALFTAAWWVSMTALLPWHCRNWAGTT